jgi:hypothetical protein
MNVTFVEVLEFKRENAIVLEMKKIVLVLAVVMNA